MEYSIWIVPPEPIYSRLKKTIDGFARELGGPKFEPHMTILGNIDKDLSEIEEKAKELGRKMDTLELSLGPVSFSTTYFQSVFVRVNSTAELMQLYLDAKKVFNMESSVFMPHMSLLYGDHDMATREKATSKVRFPAASFTVDKLVITPATHDPAQWKHVATVPFNYHA